MGKGISIYFGMGYTQKQNLEYIDFAYKNGFDFIFTSLHIPEADYNILIKEFKSMVKFAEERNMKVIADISPRTFKFLGATMKDFSVLKNMGLYGVRVDFGFSPAEIAEFTRNKYGMKIEINASTVTNKFLYEFEKSNPNYGNLQACHNYYPRMNTGISLTTYNRKNEMLKKYGIKISAFIPSLVNRRGPIFEGLPTLEMHRFMEPVVAAKHLFALGVDNVLFGDSIPSKEEIESVGSLDENIITFRLKANVVDVTQNAIIFDKTHENRPDCAEDVVRSTLSRETLKHGTSIMPFNNIERKRGTVTIDNVNYLRYCGELQITKKDLPADRRVNVIGKITDSEIFLLDYIGEETKFKFVKEK